MTQISENSAEDVFLFAQYGVSVTRDDYRSDPMICFSIFSKQRCLFQGLRLEVALQNYFRQNVATWKYQVPSGWHVASVTGKHSTELMAISLATISMMEENLYLSLFSTKALVQADISPLMLFDFLS